MLTRETIYFEASWQSSDDRRKVPVTRPSGLYLVTVYDLQELDEALTRGHLPIDFERKLCRLSAGNLIERYVAQNSRLIFSLLLAHRQGLFKLADPTADQLLRVLAYVRKDEDAIPDYQPDGLKDDAQEIRALETELRPVLQTFKAWRLQHQVPGLWLHALA